MRRLRIELRHLGRDCSGQDLIEYALLVACLAVLVGATVPTEVVPVMSSLYSKLAASLNAS